MAYHAPLITSVIDATIESDRPDLGAQLAKATAPIAACSGRLGAWGQILTRGKLAARHAGDHPTLAYLTHEDGIRSLVTSEPAAPSRIPPSRRAVIDAAPIWPS